MGKENLHRRIDPANDSEFEFQDRILKPKSGSAGAKGLLVSERIREVMMMCARENPIYEQISSFGIALYTIGYVDCEDLMSFHDIEQGEAADILRQHFTQVKAESIPSDYIITESRENYLLVIGDPLFPVHFAVITSPLSSKPFFSKLPFFGSGFDSLAELVADFTKTDGVDSDDIYYFKEAYTAKALSESMGKIYIVKDE